MSISAQPQPPEASSSQPGPTQASWRRVGPVVLAISTLIGANAVLLAVWASVAGPGGQTATLAWLGAALTGVLLAALGLAVLRPAVRTLERQAHTLHQQVRDHELRARVAEQAGNPLMVTDREGCIVWTNPAFERLSGYTQRDAQGRRPGDLLQSERTDRAVLSHVAQAMTMGLPVRAELLHRTRDGHDYWVDTDLQPLRDASGQVTGFLAVQTDITVQVGERLRREAVLAALPGGVVVHDRDGRVTAANAAARHLLGTKVGDTVDALLARQPLHEGLEPFVAHELPVARTLASGRGERGELVGLNDDDGGRRWLLVNTEPLTDALGRPDGAVACWVDMTERRRLLEQLRDDARHDALTRLPDRSVVLERVQRAIEHHRQHPTYGFAVLFLDIDHFEQVNDRLGQAAGDDVLCQVAQRLEETLRPGDALARVGSQLRTAARIGGDEFVIVLEGAHADDARQVAARLLQELSQPYRVGSHPVHLSVSIGMVGAEQAADDADAVLRDCDTAMYEAKRTGRGRCVVFDAMLHERVKQALELEIELRHAMAADELYVVYQPLVELDGGKLAGVEALVRWRHPVRGDILPGEFIGLAEECGLIDALGDLVLHKACAQFARWQQAWGRRAPLLLVVNVARAQLRQPGLVPEVLAVLEAHGMRPEQLQLDITEGFAAQDDHLVQATLRALKDAGVRLALDDFGTGYSSLACLHQLPVDAVKIDRSFVAHAREVEHHRVLISSTIRVARTLGLRTVAEGVETDEQAELMTGLGCDLGQGWLFAAPMTVPELDRWIERESTGTEA